MSFYAVFAVSIAAGIALDFLNIDPFKALFWTAVVNGVLAPFLMIGIWLVATDHILMNGQTSTLLSRTTVAVATLLMLGAAIGLLAF